MNAGTETSAHDDARRMQCMEVWGGNGRVDQSFELPGLKIWVYSRPYQDAESGGDVYYLSSCASGRITRLLLADVSGHGPEVSDLALGLRDLMRKNVNVVRQVRFVEGMNRQFQNLAECGSFATALVGTFFQPNRRLALCNAGHPAPLHFSAANASWSHIEHAAPQTAVVAGTPLGIVESAKYPLVDTTLAAGDLVLLFSDALIESRDEQGQLLGPDGVFRVVASLDPSQPVSLLQSLIGQVEKGRTELQRSDDVTLILMQATSTATRLRDNLMAPFRLLRSVKDRTHFQA